MISGPAGTGKTFGVLAVLHLILACNPNLRLLACRKTRKALTESAMVTYEQGILPADGMQSIAGGAQRRVRESYRYPNGSELVVGGIDDPEKIKSSDWDLIYANEATELSEHDWEFLASRLGRPGRPTGLGLLIGDCNPDAPTHWLKQRDEAGRTALWVTTHEANPRMFDGRAWTDEGVRYLSQLDGLTGVRYQRLRLGRWVGAEGLVHDEWDANVHLIDPFPIPGDWRRIRSIDFGYTNAFVCQWWAIDHDGRMHRYRELYGTRRLVSDWARRIKDLSQGESIRDTVSDHDAEDRATLEAAGIPTVPAHKAVLPGIEAVQLRLRRQGDGKPRIFLHRHARIDRDATLAEARKPTCTEEEFDRYVWAKAKDGRPDKEEPLKLDDHGMDAMRYAVAFVDGIGPGRGVSAVAAPAYRG